MRAFNPVGLLTAAIAVGATTPLPTDSLPAILWSSTTASILAFNGTSWQAIGMTAPTTVVDSTTSRNITASDNNTDLIFTNAAAITITFPTTLGVNFRCIIWQAGAGQITFAKDATFSWLCKSATPKSSGLGSCIEVIQTTSTQIGVKGDYL